MKTKIFRLPDPVINQIAAGEVVEHPASIVKELIENSLDANAKKIAVEIVQGGQQFISVEDDGYGMSPEDALLCLERHATSKIRSVEDLDLLCTMGFRGEALAAIAAVSHLELKTSDGVATRVVASGGKVTLVEPCARNQGTTIEIRSLFFNVPARRKFQKSAGTNAAQVRKVVETISLAHEDIAFSLTINGKKVFEVFPSSKALRIQEVLGEYEHEVSASALFGFIASPIRASSSRSGQYLFINKRPIFSPLIAKAVKEGFGTRISEHSYPPFVLFLEIPPDNVDINVHPQKKEARFKDESGLFRQVQSAVESAFGPVLPTSFNPIDFSPPLQEISFEESFLTPAFKTMENQELDLSFRDQFLTVVNQYLLIQRDSLILIDLTAAHARILFEDLKYEKAAMQTLIWPLEIKLQIGEEHLAEELNALGIECRLLQKTLVIDELPAFLDATDFPLFFSKWKEGKKLENTAVRFSRARKSYYLMHEAMEIWKKVQKCKDQMYDPLGNPISKEIKVEDLALLLGKGKNKSYLVEE
jgi:DNA mismatch repair protein MutL